MNPFLEGLGKLIGKISDNTQGRIERLKNEKAELEKEQIALDKKDSTVLNAYLSEKIQTRIKQINTILANNAKD